MIQTSLHRLIIAYKSLTGDYSSNVLAIPTEAIIAYKSLTGDYSSR